ncbi:hypothetical protein NEHOM01_0651 [Nematocida homosporus]|uniref:uncharacterized protein n=1 Tax=Nematocida homosporus TaxID=1912981 RepID=UPI002220C0FB|nr:uncharacterized protein NEHOM01_0651 [Nematocida homosporus]KAI5185146.1 hypothetical protein NEHOM01_0651 [Nematocida homosporus]
MLFPYQEIIYLYENTDFSIMIEYDMIPGKPINARQFKMLMCWFIGLFVLFERLNAVGCSEEVGVVETLPSSDELIRDLRTTGFVFTSDEFTLLATPYTSKKSQEADPTPGTILNTPQYALTYSGFEIEFYLPNYSSETKANDALEYLRTIAFIKVSSALVAYTETKPDYHKINMQILSRVVNMFDCEELVIYPKDAQDKSAQNRLVDSSVCLAEALNTTKHADYDSACEVFFSTIAHIRLSDIIHSDVVLRRPITKVTLADNEFQNTPYLTQLPLKDNYTLVFEQLPSVAVINLAVLQRPSPSCDWIIFTESQNSDITLIGLTEVIDRHPALTLDMSWDILRRMVKTNKPMSRVHAIYGLTISLQSHQETLEFLQNQPPIESIFTVDMVVLEVANDMPCDSFGYYKQIYTREALSKYGISTDKIEIVYLERDDFFATISALCRINALSLTIQDEIRDNDINCCGDKLNNPTWKLQETVKVNIARRYTTYWLNDYKQKCSTYFCQHIHYATLILMGHKTPHSNHAQLCIGFLNLLQNITGKELHISDLRGSNQTTTNFDMASLEAESIKSPKYKLNVDVLVLDNVDDSIIYWMLGHYDIASSVEVRILNQGFRNLAIAQVLSYPIGQKVSTLVVNDLSGLDEIKQYMSPRSTQDFLLFNYVEAAKETGQSTEDIGLNKLFLQHLEDLGPGLNSNVLGMFARCGLQPTIITFDDYITSALTRTNQYLHVKRTVVILYDITLESLQTDLANCQTTNNIFTNPSLDTKHTLIQRESIKNLLLCFRDSQPLTESDLVDIIRWVACRFDNVVVLRLRNVTLTTEERAVIASRNYWICGLDSLERVILVDENSNGTPIMLGLNQYHKSLLMNVDNSTTEFTAVASATVFRLLTCLDQATTPIAEQARAKPSFKMIIDNIDANKTKPHEIVCPVCLDSLCIDPKDENAKTEDNKKPTTEDDKKSTTEDTTSSGKPKFNSECPTTFYYLECTHIVCGKCVINSQSTKNPIIQCTLCRKNIFEDMHRLIDVPLSSCVFAGDNSSISPAASNWLNSMAFGDKHIYFYTSYKSLADLQTDIENTPAYNDSNPIYII